MIIDEIKQLIADLTGFSVSDLTPEKNLQMDLALDSIKMMGLMSQLVTRFDHIRPLSLADLVQWEVIGDIFAYYGVNSEENELSIQQPGIAISESDVKFPMLNSQQLFLLSHSLNAGNGLCTRLKLTGKLDFNIIRQAWQLLVDRLPALRTYYVLPENATSFNETVCYLKKEATVPEIGVIYLQDEQHADELINERINKDWELDQWPLHQFDIGILNDNECYIYFSNDHVISDGRGNQKIITEFMRIYDSLVKGEAADLEQPITDTEFANTITAINETSAEYCESDYHEYMKGIGNQPFFWNPNNVLLEPSKSRYKNLYSQLSAELTERLQRLTRKYEVSMNTLLIGAFVRALHNMDSELKDVVLQIPTSGTLYSISKIENMVGCFAQNIPYMTKHSFSHEKFEEQIKDLHGELYLAISQGIDSLQSDITASVVRDTVTLHRRQIPSKMLPLIRGFIRSNLYVPYIGRVDLNQNYGNLEVVEYRPATSNSSGAIDFLQEIHDGQLVISLNYDDLLFDYSMMERLMKTYHQSLLELADSTIPRDVVDEGDNAFSSRQFELKSKNNQVPDSYMPQQDINGFVTYLIDDIAETANVKLTEKDVDLHFEADIGIDSLEIIRVFNKIAKKYNIKDKQSLFKCRTINQLVSFISGPGPNANANANANDISETHFHSEVDPIPFQHIVRQASLTPDATAVYDKGSRLTYRELDESSNRLANYLISEGIGPGKLVAIHLNRSCEMITAMIAVLKAGAAYVPIDDNFPVQRVSYIIEHAECDILIANSRVAKQVDELLLNIDAVNTVIFMDQWTPLLRNNGSANVSQISKAAWSSCSATAPEVRISPDDTMIVLYTSGSTGNPKGVELNHAGYMVRMEWHQDLFGLRAGDRVAQKTSCSFDISVWEIFWPLMLGGEMAIVDTDTVKNPWALADWLTTESINYMHFVPSMLGEFLNAVEGDAPDLSAMKYLVCSGEALPRAFVRHWFHQFGTIPLANLYGPTEASIDVSAHVITAMPEDNDEPIPIGVEMPGVQLLMIDEQGRRVSPGGTGELCIAGPQLAKGYLNDKQKTASTFIDNVWSDIDSAKVYKTGDLVTCDSSGCYIYKGRLDHQIKIRGYRVELGEIENVLLSHPNLEEVGVVVREINNSQKIVCFYAGKKTALDDITNYAKGKLPAYMLPNYVIHLDALPKNHNGKLDRKAILQLDVDLSRQGKDTLLSLPAEKSQAMPLGPAQRWIMRHFDKPYSWFGYHRFTYKQALDLDAFTQSLNQLVSEHDALRTAFVQSGETYYQDVVGGGRQVVKPLLFSAEHLTKPELDEQVAIKIEELMADINIEMFPLWRLLVVKLTDNKYDISIVGHHLISDMVSSSVFFRLLWQNYSLLLESGQPLPARGTSQYGEYVNKLSEMDSRGLLNDHIEYWNSQLSSIEAKSIIPLDNEEGLNEQVSEEVVSRTLSEKETARLITIAKDQYHSTLYSVLACPLYDLLASSLELESVVISHKLNGRGIDVGGINTSESIGNYAINVPLALKWDCNDSWEHKVSNVEKGISAIPMSGITYDWLGDRLSESCYPDDKLTSIRLNYLGNVTGPKSELFEFDERDSHQRISIPKQKRVSEIEVWVSIHEQQICVRVGYSTNRYQRERIERLADEYISRLLSLIEIKSDIEEPFKQQFRAI